VILCFVIYIGSRPGLRWEPDESAAQSNPRRNWYRMFWLGILLALAPGLLYLYFSVAMVQFHPGAVVFLGVPIMLAGIACIVRALWSIIRT